MKKVSIIIPIYNGENYIENIFKRICAQSFSEVEVVFVNDGSTDDSGKVIREFIDRVISENGQEALVPEFKLIAQTNTGQGGARNRGIEEASGDYLMFMDQDDIIKPDYVERLLSEAEKSAADIVISGYEHVNSSGDVKEHVELVNNEWCRFMNITPWGKIYRRNFIMRKNIRFLPVPLGEDIYFNVLCYSHTDKVAYTNYIGYQWVINDSSVSNTVHRSVSREANVIDLFNALSEMDTADKWMKDIEFEYFMLKTGIFHILYAAKGTDVSDLFSYEDRIFGWLKAHIPEINKNPLISLSKPEGERSGVRYAVYVFVLLRRIHMDKIFLRVFHALP
ncbi:glycosyltransferase family 2 protein [Butyrivibrio sp. JL13D10]|uniref:glycosyltransferase family 2 protein n=1 Tax=Butyrivibrio sp. JL13D10 TaxID=3236815 RepID=UPI0038B4D85C